MAPRTAVSTMTGVGGSARRRRCLFRFGFATAGKQRDGPNHERDETDVPFINRHKVPMIDCSVAKAIRYRASPSS